MWIACGRPAPAAFIRWSPWSIYEIHDEIRALIPAAEIINDTRFFCAKDNVHEHFKRTFGRTLTIDPRTYCGLGVRKSKRNAVHDGEVLNFPISTVRADSVYERLIDNTAHPGMVVDIRLPIILDAIPFAYLKYRPINDRFSNDNSYCELHDASKVLSSEELIRCLTFAESIGLDYGEIDVLRDRSTDELWIVDANNTPWGPPNGLPIEQAEKAIEQLGQSFGRNVFGSTRSSVLMHGDPASRASTGGHHYQ